MPTNQRGFTLVELLATLALSATLTAIAISHVTSQQIQIRAAQLSVIAQLRTARMNAITSVSHYGVKFTSASQFQVFPMTYNGTAWQLASTATNTIKLPSATSFPSALVGTRIEFNSRGMPVNTSGVLLTAVTQINITDRFNGTRSLQVWPSGQVNEL